MKNDQMMHVRVLERDKNEKAEIIKSQAIGLHYVQLPSFP